MLHSFCLAGILSYVVAPNVAKLSQNLQYLMWCRSYCNDAVYTHPVTSRIGIVFGLTYVST